MVIFERAGPVRDSGSTNWAPWASSSKLDRKARYDSQVTTHDWLVGGEVKRD
jgi:hypothetical protein